MKREDVLMVVSSILVFAIASALISFMNLNRLIEDIIMDNLFLGYVLILCTIALILILLLYMKKRIYKDKNVEKLNKNERIKFTGVVAVFTLITIFLTGNPPLSYLTNMLGSISTIVYAVVVGVFSSWYYKKILNYRKASN